MLLCIHCHDHGYACIVGKRCIVMVIVVVFFHHDAINMLLWRCVGWYRVGDVVHHSEIAALDLRVRVDHHTGLYVGYLVMLVNVFYTH